MARRTPLGRKPGQRRWPATRLFGVPLAFLALCLRLVLSTPAVPPPPPDADFATAFGEHALCLAVAAIDDKATLPDDHRVPGPGDHADHDGLGCCLWHAAVGFTLPRITTVARVAFVEIRLPRLKTPASAGPLRPAGPLQARAPPEVS